MKKGVSLLLSFALLGTLAAACSGGGADSTGRDESASNPSPGATDETAFSGGHSAPFANGKFDPPVTMTTVTHLASSIVFKDGENIENNYHTEWAKERFGIELEYLWTTTGPSDAFATKVRLMLAANEPMPDAFMVRGNSALLHELIDSGRFMEVGELFDQYASDTWKDAMNENPDAWSEVMRDGKKYGVPVLDYTHNNDAVMWIRKDWLEKLNLQAPTTLEELEQVMDAFVNQDPDGNGKKDTLGLAVGFKNGFYNNMGDLSWLFGAHGAYQIPGQWNVTPEGDLKYGSVEPAVKEGLATLKSWMEKGYIHKEAGLYIPDDAAADFTSGRAGIIFGAHWMPGWPLGDLEKNVPGAEYDAYPIPSGPDGKIGRTMTLGVNGALLISKDYKHPDAFFVYQSYLFDHFANPQIGGEFEHGFAEGYDWIMEDGKPRALQGAEGKITVNKYTLMGEGARIPSLMMSTLDKLYKGSPAETPFEKIMADGRDPRLHKAGSLVLQQAEAGYPNKFTGAPTPTMRARWDFLKTTENETFQKMIYGEQPLDSFERFVDDWYASGGSDITEEVNDWYRSIP